MYRGGSTEALEAYLHYMRFFVASIIYDLLHAISLIHKVTDATQRTHIPAYRLMIADPAPRH